MQTITTTLCNIAGDSFTTEIQYKYDRLAKAYIVLKPSFVDESFGTGWIEDMMIDLRPVIGRDCEVCIVDCGEVKSVVEIYNNK